MSVRLPDVNIQIQKQQLISDFRIKSTLGVAIIALILLTPFSINNFYQDRDLLGAGSLAVVALCAMNAWNCIHHRYYPVFIFSSMVPAIIVFLVIAFREQGIISVFWCYPAVLAFYFILPERLAWIANIILICIIFPQAWHVIELPLVFRFGVTILAVSAFSALFIRVITDQQRMLEVQAITDPLTGLYNRTLLHDTLEDMVHQYDRSGTPMTLVELDLDDFKEINDEFGHDAGDRVLRGIGEFLNSRVRGTDKVYRVGGEEFLVLLFNTDLESGLEVAEELRSKLASLTLHPDRAVTASVGVATLQAGESQMEWVKRCDVNLYQAKSSGRNRVVSHSM